MAEFPLSFTRASTWTWVLTLTAAGFALLSACSNETQPGGSDGEGGDNSADCQGDENCACYGNGTCNDELVCISDRCEGVDGADGGATHTGGNEGNEPGSGGKDAGDSGGADGSNSGGSNTGGSGASGSGGDDSGGNGAAGNGDPIDFEDPLAGNLTAKTVSLYTATTSTGHGCIGSEEGEIYCWGFNGSGQLGNGTDVGSSTPVQVSDISTAEKVVTGEAHSCALLSDGTVRCWGDNNYYYLGTGDQVDAWEPVEPSGLTDVIDIATRSSHSCAVQQDGEVLCWGFSGEHLGYSGIGSVPKVVTGLAGNAQAIAVGGAFSCALIEGGSVQCWGSNSAGQLGHDDNADDASQSPVDVVGVDGAVALSSGSSHICALIDDGTVWCWGAGTSHQLGKNSGTNSYAPTQVVGLDDAASVSAGLQHTCAARDNGTVSCWGKSDYGEAGTGTTATVLRAWDVMQGIDNAVEVYAGTFSSCAVLEGGAVQCWGDNQNARIALASDLEFTRVHRTPAGFLQGGEWYAPYDPQFPPAAGDIVQIEAASHRTCVVRAGGEVDCWGNNSDDLIGDGSTDPVFVPTSVNTLSEVTHLSDFGGGQMCARKSDDSLQCLGSGSPPTRLNNAIAVTNGYDFGCAVVGSLAVQCWGNDFAHTHTLSRGAVDVTAGSNHMCAVLNDGTMHCWGFFDEASLGSNQPGLSGLPYEPSTVEGVSDAVKAAAGLSHTCALLSDGHVMCWGANTDGQLGDGTGTYRRLAVDVGLSDVTHISSGWYHSCAVSDGAVYCWGDNASGQIGDDGIGDALAPVQVVGITDGVQVTCSQQHSCALHEDGSVSCWGNNERGELGDGTQVSSPVPVQVEGL